MEANGDSDESAAVVQPDEVAAAPSGTPMIVFESVTKVYDPNVVALRETSFVIDKGEAAAITRTKDRALMEPPPHVDAGASPSGGGSCS